MISRVIKSLLINDFILGFAFGLLIPFLSVFVLQDIEGGTLEIAGLSFTFYWVARLVTTTPLSRFMDKTDGEKDEYYFLVFGSLLVSTLIIFLVWATLPWHIYLIQALLGVSNSMVVPGWRILFTDHLDKGKIGLEWSFDDIAVGAATALSAYLGGIIANRFGFDVLFIIVAIIGYTSTIVLIPTWKNIRKTRKEKPALGIPAKLETTK